MWLRRRRTPATHGKDYPLTTTIILILLIALLGCSGGNVKPDESSSRIRRAGILRVAIDPSYPPFAYVDNSGQVAGFDADLSRELASRLGVKVSFIGIEVTTMFDALIARKADVAISAIAPVPEYAKEIGYSRSYFNAGQILVVPSGFRPINNLENLGEAVLGVEIGSNGELEARKLAGENSAISVKSFDSLEAAVEALTVGQVSAVIADRVTASVLLQTQPSGLKIAGRPFTEEPYVIAVNGTDKALLKEIDAILSTMAEDGFLRHLETRFSVS